jgi:hypothetical protein
LCDFCFSLFFLLLLLNILIRGVIIVGGRASF